MTAMIRLIWMFLFCGCCAVCSGQLNHWQQGIEYTIEVGLNDREHALTGNLAVVYRNNSPDTIHHIWFQLWPNAFKNDRTAFTEQQLTLGKTDFYFSRPEDRGYINRLDFRSGDISLETEDHPNFIDLVKVNLPGPLLPGTAANITTPFHIKLPAIFGALGHKDQVYKLVDWYPKIAVYDQFGWHPEPYLEQGNHYSENASYHVTITLPANYLVAATGKLQNENELRWLYSRQQPPEKQQVKVVQKKSFGKPAPKYLPVQPDSQTKTLHYASENVNDFVLFAGKDFWLDTSSVLLRSGKRIGLWNFVGPGISASQSKESLNRVAETIHFNSAMLGDLRWPVLSVWTADSDKEKLYPGVYQPAKNSTFKSDHRSLSEAWFDPRTARAPWLIDGVNTWLTYYYAYQKDHKHDRDYFRHFNDLVDLNVIRRVQQSAEMQKTDQLMRTPHDSLTPENYELNPYKTADWIRMIEQRKGGESFLTGLRTFYQESLTGRVETGDFERLMNEKIASEDDSLFSLSDQTGPLVPLAPARAVKPVFLFATSPSVSENRQFFLPVVGYNVSDGIMIGAGVGNYGAKYHKFRFFATPVFATKSKQVNGLADFAYTHHPSNRKYSYRIGAGFSKFSMLSDIDSNGSRISAGFIKFTPSFRVNIKSSDPLATTEKFIEWKTFIIGESGFDYKQKQSDMEFYPVKSGMQYRYINQLTFSVSDPRVLYPYHGSIQLQQARDFYRVNLDAGYFFNYARGGGAGIRLFAAKFGYLGDKTVGAVFGTQRFQPKLTAVRGDEDYTYSNYFIGRQEADGLFSQQIMMRDGGLKLRTDIFQDLQGRSDDWVTSMNFSTTIPSTIFPSVIPLKLFFDIGTYAGAWKETAEGSRFLYVGGLQLSFFHNLLNVYAPVIYSKAFSNSLKTVPEENKFMRKISFSIDLHTLQARRVMKKYHTVF